MATSARWLAALAASVMVGPLGTIPTHAATTYELLGEPLKADLTYFSIRVPSGSFDTPVMSANARFVLYLVEEGSALTGYATLVYVFDRVTKSRELVTKSSRGVKGKPPGGFVSSVGSISADGRYVAFCSLSPNLVAGDKNDFVDVFVRDRMLHTTVRVNLDPKGRELPKPAETNESSSAADCRVAVSPDGSKVLWRTPQDVLNDGAKGYTFYEYNRLTRRTVAVDRLPGTKTGADVQMRRGAALSRDGRYVVFTTSQQMVAADTDEEPDVYRRDVAAGTTMLVSAPSAVTRFEPALSTVPRSPAAQTDPYLRADSNSYDGATIDGSGRYVAFHATVVRNNVGYGGGYTLENVGARVIVRDLVTGAASVLAQRDVTTSHGPGVERRPLLGDPVITQDGRSILYVVPENNGSYRKSLSSDQQEDATTNWPVLYRVATSGGTPVALTAPLYTACVDQYCPTTQHPTKTGANHIYGFAATATATEVLFVSDMPFVAADADTGKDLYSWRG